MPSMVWIRDILGIGEAFGGERCQYLARRDDKCAQTARFEEFIFLPLYIIGSIVI